MKYPRTQTTAVVIRHGWDRKYWIFGLELKKKKNKPNFEGTKPDNEEENIIF